LRNNGAVQDVSGGEKRNEKKQRKNEKTKHV
jgi:hypothetical protein